MAIDLNGSTGISLDDNEKINLGNSDDLQIYHDGSDSYIKDAGTGHLKILAGNFYVNNAADNQNMISAINGGATSIMYNGGTKLATTSTGVDVTGTVTSDAYALDSIALPSAGTATIFNRNTDNNLYIQTGSGNTLNLLDGSQNTMYSVSPTSHIFQISNAEKMRIDSSGNVGIGTSNGDVTNDSTAARTYVGIIGNANRGVLNIGSTASAGADGGKISFVNGANVTGEISCDPDSGSATNGNLAFNTSGSQRMRIDSSGKVGIGDSSPSARLEIGGMAAGEQALLIQSGRNDALSNGLARINITDSNCPFEGLRIDHAGTGTGLVVKSTSSGVPMLIERNTDAQVILFYRSGSNVGNIAVTGSSTSYNTSSDYRLKENVVDLTGASARVNQLNPSRFNFIADADTTVDGFLAHEVATVVPEAITGVKDAMKDEEYEVTPATGDIYTPATDEVDEVIHSADAQEPETLEDGQQWRETTAAVMGTRSVPDYQGIDQSKLVPLLTAALQEALTEIASLKTRVEALEA